jgi:hypothetical protein
VFAPDRRGRRGRDREAPAPQPAGDFRGSVLEARLDFDLHRRTLAAYPVDFPISCDFNGLQQGKFSLHSISAARRGAMRTTRPQDREDDLCISFIAVSGPMEAIENDSINSIGQKDKSLIF